MSYIKTVQLFFTYLQEQDYTFDVAIHGPNRELYARIPNQKIGKVLYSTNSFTLCTTDSKKTITNEIEVAVKNFKHISSDAIILTIQSESDVPTFFEALDKTSERHHFYVESKSGVLFDLLHAKKGKMKKK